MCKLRDVKMVQNGGTVMCTGGKVKVDVHEKKGYRY